MEIVNGKIKRHACSLKTVALFPGARVSKDRFKSWHLSRTLNSYGGSSVDKSVSGCIFVDHALLSIKFGFLMFRLFEQSRTIKVCLWKQVILFRNI